MKKVFKTLFGFATVGVPLLLSPIVAVTLLLDWYLGFHRPPAITFAIPQDMTVFFTGYQNWLVVLGYFELAMGIAFVYITMVLLGIAMREIYRNGHSVHITEKEYKKTLHDLEFAKRELEEWKKKHSDAVASAEDHKAEAGKHKAMIDELHQKLIDHHEKLPDRIVDSLFVRAQAMRQQLPPPEEELREEQEETKTEPCKDVPAKEDLELSAQVIDTIADAAPPPKAEPIVETPTPKPEKPMKNNRWNRWMGKAKSLANAMDHPTH